MTEFSPAPVKPTMVIAALEALDIRVGTIERVEEVPRSDKLMKLTVNFGDHSRMILAGRKKERSNPREIEECQTLFVGENRPGLNPGPRKMAGEISGGILFDVGYADGVTPVLAVRERAVPNTTRAG
jgi:tRNA-binding protein